MLEINMKLKKFTLSSLSLLMLTSCSALNDSEFEQLVVYVETNGRYYEDNPSYFNQYFLDLYTSTSPYATVSLNYNANTESFDVSTQYSLPNVNAPSRFYYYFYKGDKIKKSAYLFLSDDCEIKMELSFKKHTLSEVKSYEVEKNDDLISDHVIRNAISIIPSFTFSVLSDFLADENLPFFY